MTALWKRFVQMSPLVEAPRPVDIRLGGQVYTLTLAEAERMHRELTECVEALQGYFQCAHTWPSAIWKDRPSRCWARGKVKVGDRWWCRRHAPKTEEQR